jgi:hypothetical protein
MTRFAIEHLPRSAATYQVRPVDFAEAQAFLSSPGLTSLVRTTEMIDAVRAGFALELKQAETAMLLQPGDEALLICLSFSVLLAWSQGGIVPLPEDWRCLRISVRPHATGGEPLAAAVPDDLASEPLA